ncbi:MAG: cell division protein SepF [Acidimicrobiales bacterium]
MLYLGLGPDDEYDEYEGYDMVEEPESPGGYWYPARESAEPPTRTVRPVAREPEPEKPPPPPTRQRTGVVRPILAPPPSPKPFAVSPGSFNDAQEVADKFMAGVPVIVNLQGVDRELSRRLVDFSSGLCYGLNGQMDRVTNQVYLLTPSNVQVSDEEKRRLHERTT